MKTGRINQSGYRLSLPKYALALLLIVVFTSIANGQNAPNMNVLFIAIDDLKPILGSYGDTLIQTPNLDRLADDGTIFRNNHCQQAVCGPSRASLLTGRRPDFTQVWNLHTLIRDINPNIVTLPQYFKQNGYETAATGKVFDPRSVDNGHDNVSWSIPYAKVSGSRWIYSTEKISTESGDVPDTSLVDGKIALKGMELLQSLAAGSNPFFLAVGFKKPHLPFVAPQKYWDLYDRNDFSIHPFQQDSTNAPDFAFQPGWELRNYVDIPKEDPIPEEKQKELIHGYHACVSFVDVQVGMLLDQLDSLGLRDNTIVIVWGDHGWHLGDHDMWAKHTNFEQATRSPMIISVPGISGGKKSDSPTEFVDIFPTLCELTGLNIPQDLEGISLVPILENPDTMVKQYAISQYHRTSAGEKLEGYALRTKRYRYVEWVSGGFKSFMHYDENNVVARELYDYQTDPLETVSVADSATYATVAAELHGMLKDFFLSKEIITGIRDSDHSPPSAFSLLHNYPNPFNPETIIEYTLQKTGTANLTVYNTLGEVVSVLTNKKQVPGRYKVSWNGLDENGRQVSSGVYFFRLFFDAGDASASASITRKMLLMR